MSGSRHNAPGPAGPGTLTRERRDEIHETFGPGGEAWVAELPARIAALAREWNLVDVVALPDTGQCAWIGAARRDGEAVILKISVPHDEARFEGEALRGWAGDGAVRLLAASDDGFALLLERLVPGHGLRGSGGDAADEIVARLLPRLWRPADPAWPFARLVEVVADWRTGWAAGASVLDPATIAAAHEFADALLERPPAPLLLHGDLHPDNVLLGARGWLAIDPKPVLGEPAYDWAQTLENGCRDALAGPDPCEAMRRRIVRVAARTGLDPARVAAWAFVKSVGWDAPPAHARLFHRVAAALR